jgi:hypothetical protein
VFQLRRGLAHLTWPVVLPLVLAIGLLVVAVAPVDAATITVNSTGEEQTNNGLCTLFEALNNANSDAPNSLDCISGSGADTIRFQIPTFSDFGCNPSTRVCTIVTAFTYSMFDPVTIDGYTQTNTSPNTLDVGDNAVIRIRLLPANSSVNTGLRVVANDVTIRGLAIGGYANYGIQVESGERATIIGCFIGTDAAGTTAVANGQAGIRLDVASLRARIGGTSPADRNVISGNATFLGTQAGILITGASSSVIQGNYIGLKANGSEALGNFNGVEIQGASVNTIGGTTAGAGNVISGNGGRGIVVDNAGSLAFANFIQGNSIGYNAAGTGFIGNGSQGIRIASADSSSIGGPEPGAGNRIGGNAGAGVLILDDEGNEIQGNSIVGNGGLGIDLGGDGVTPNDVNLGDPDSGPNELQNYPVLTSVGVRVNNTVHGALSSTPNRQFRIEFFSNAACDASGFGEGETFLGFVNIATNALGNAEFMTTFSPIPVGRFVTATATNESTGDTSEFSLCKQAVAAGLNISSLTATTTEVNETSSGDWLFNTSLASIPTANVTFPLSISDPTEGRLLEGSSITYTPSRATSNHIIPLEGVDDGIDDGDVGYTFVIGPAVSADPNYNGLNPSDVTVTNLDNDDRTAQCNPRPRVHVSVVKIGGGKLRATVLVTTNPNTQNEIQTITWTKVDTVTVALDGGGPVQQGNVSTFGTPLTQSASFVITRTPGASSGTVRLTVTDGCGAWPTFVGGGPNGW